MGLLFTRLIKKIKCVSPLPSPLLFFFQSPHFHRLPQRGGGPWKLGTMGVAAVKQARVARNTTQTRSRVWTSKLIVRERVPGTHDDDDVLWGIRSGVTVDGGAVAVITEPATGTAACCGAVTVGGLGVGLKH